MSSANADPRTPDEPRALIAVDRSARAYARAFPYLQWRYGEFGDGFVRSDNAHLIALAEHDPEELDRQVRWTADQLANRGIPGWMLEVDLKLMGRSVKRLLPERPDIAHRLLRASSELAKLRHAVMGELRFRRCAEGFAVALGCPPAPCWIGMGCILAAAVADEGRGVSHAVDRVTEWAADKRRFGEPWLGAVDQTLAHARRLV